MDRQEQKYFMRVTMRIKERKSCLKQFTKASKKCQKFLICQKKKNSQLNSHRLYVFLTELQKIDTSIGVYRSSFFSHKAVRKMTVSSQVLELLKCYYRHLRSYFPQFSFLRWTGLPSDAFLVNDQRICLYQASQGAYTWVLEDVQPFNACP